MNYNKLPFNPEFDVIDHLPREFYTDEEWEEIIMDCDKIVDGIMLTKVEPEILDETKEFLMNLF